MQAIVNGTYGCAVGLGLFCLGLVCPAVGLFSGCVALYPLCRAGDGGALLPIALSLAVFTGWVKPLVVGGLFVLLELVTNMILEPLLYGQCWGLTGGVTAGHCFLDLALGACRLLLATPLTVCLGVLGKYVPQLAFLEVLLSDEEVTELNRYYQRLVARDQDGAVEIVEELLQTQTLADVYDTVLLPALYYTEQDQRRGTLTAEEGAAFTRPRASWSTT